MARLPNNSEIILRGQKITLRDLQSIMPNSHALIINKLLYYVAKQKFVIYPYGSNMPFVRRSLREWSDDLELWFGNGNKRKMSQATVGIVFKKLVRDGLVTYINYNSRIRSYAICESNLIRKISDITGLKFKELKELPEDYLGDEIWSEPEEKYDESTMKVDLNPQENQGLQGNSDTDMKNEHHHMAKNTGKVAENMGKIGKSMIKVAESMMKVGFKPQGNQGLQGNSGTGTYTNTYTDTDTYNKSHKSEERDFSKKTPQRGEAIKIGAILRGSSDPDAVHNSTTVQNMFKIWQEEFPDSDERLNTRSASWLKAAYDSSFNCDLMAWRNYLRKAKTSEFITDRPHLLCLKWLLSFETIDNIGRGAYDVTEPALDMAEVEAQRNAMSDELIQQIEELDEPGICKKQRLKILNQIGPFAYEAWFSKVSMELRNGEIKCSGTNFNLDRIAERYSDLLKLESENSVPAEKVVPVEKVVEVEHLPNFQSIRQQTSLRSCHG